MKRALIMTATIRPPEGMTWLARSDPNQRMQDYLEALRFNLTLPNRAIDRIVFVDNSKSDLSPLRAAADQYGRGKQIELLSFAGLDYPPHYGKAHGELRLLDHAMDHSALLSEFGADDVCWKVTGRYRVRNLARLVEMAPRGYALYGDFRLRAVKWFDMRVFSFTRAGYDRFFRGRYVDLREGLPDDPRPPTETAVFDWLWPRRHEGIVPLFRVEPWVEGIQAYCNQPWMGGHQTFRFLLRAGLRRICPGWWFHGRRPWSRDR